MAVTCIYPTNVTALILKHAMVTNLRFVANYLMSCVVLVLRCVSGSHIFAWLMAILAAIFKVSGFGMFIVTGAA
jgi:hypothetical protein